jgi:hypothetical protein
MRLATAKEPIVAYLVSSRAIDPSNVAIDLKHRDTWNPKILLYSYGLEEI